MTNWNLFTSKISKRRKTLDSKTINSLKQKQPFQKAGLRYLNWLDQIAQGVDVHLIDGTVLRVRRMANFDVPTVCHLEEKIFPSPWTEEGFLYKLDNHHFNLSLIGQIGEEVVAYTVSFFILDELHLSNIAVKPGVRRKKIGETLLWISLQVGLEMGAQRVHLEVRKSNKTAIALYQKYQFEIVGIRKGYYESENEDALLMSRNLKLEKTHGLV